MACREARLFPAWASSENAQHARSLEKAKDISAFIAEQPLWTGQGSASGRSFQKLAATRS
jgi:hypothetical protein